MASIVSDTNTRALEMSKRNLVFEVSKAEHKIYLLPCSILCKSRISAGEFVNTESCE